MKRTNQQVVPEESRELRRESLRAAIQPKIDSATMLKVNPTITKKQYEKPGTQSTVFVVLQKQINRMTETSFKTLTLNITGQTAEITINRPEKLNALSGQVLEDLRQAVTQIRENANLRAAIITGTGEKAFVAGADIAELSRLSGHEEGTAFAGNGQDVFNLIESSPRPFIAAVNGFALGGGCELALACHIRICSENAKFGQPEVNLGIIPGYGGTQRLTRVVGRSYAADLILTGRMIGAQEALAQGLVSRVLPPAELIAAAREIATTIAGKAPLAITSAIEAVTMGIEEPIESGLDREAQLFGRLVTTSDFREGTGAFLEKRQAKFLGE